MMAASSSQNRDLQTTEEHVVRLPRDSKKRLTVMKFASGTEIDFAKLGQKQITIERENNFKDYKLANDIDTMPKFGAGSEYGREQKEEARKKKYGIMIKPYKVEEQPWLLKLGSGKNAKKYKGVRAGTITENTSYYIFTQCADGAFEAFPVEAWYNFAPIIRYKFLNSEEAEEEFTRRDKTLNLSNIMLKKRMRNEEKDNDADEDEKPKKKDGKRAGGEFMLTDMEEWPEDEEEDDDEDDDNEDKPKVSKKKDKKGKAKPKKKKKNSKHNADDEAIEESDEGDFDDREVDYMSDSNSSVSEVEECPDKGVDEEVRGPNGSESDDEEEEEKKEEEDEEDKEKNGKEKPAGGSDSESSVSSSDSESDIEREGTLASALFMQKNAEKEKKKEKDRTASPKPGASEEKASKRKAEGDHVSAKKPRTDSPITTQANMSTSEGITEEAIRRYLMRKPTTTRELSQKCKKLAKKLNMTNEEMTHKIAQLLKRINPDQEKINNVLFLSLKKPE